MQITKSDIRPQIKRAVSLVTADDHFNLPLEFVWVCKGYYTHFITPEGEIADESSHCPTEKLPSLTIMIYMLYGQTFSMTTSFIFATLS